MNQAVNSCLAGWNSIGQAFCGYAASAFVQSALLVILLFALDTLWHKRVRAVFRYCVWLLVLVKLVLPPTLSLPSGIGYWVPNRLPAASPVTDRVSDVIEYEATKQRPYVGPESAGGIPPARPSSDLPVTDAPAAPAALGWASVTWQAVVLLLWLVGVLAFTALLAQRLRFVRGLVAASTPAGNGLVGLLEQCRRQMGVRRPVGLRTLDTLPSPAVCGLWKPVILMPTLLVERLSPEGLQAALIHELAHIKRADLWINAVQTFLQVVYFYNPFVWLANAIIRRTCEEAVDETVLVTLGGQAKNYSNTLIDISEMAFWKADFGLRLIGVAESRKALQGRIKHMLTRPVPQSARIGALGMIAILVVAAVLLPMARAERSGREASATGPKTGAETTPKAPVTGESDTIVDPSTGLTFKPVVLIKGENDVIQIGERPGAIYAIDLGLSPNGRFLLGQGKVVPLDGSPAFKLEELREAAQAVWSPDGKAIAFHSKGIWVLPVSPDTGRTTGAARKLADDPADRTLRAIEWTSDAQQIRLYYTDSRGLHGGATCLSVQDGKGVPSPERPSAGLDYARFGLRSPNGRRVAFARHWGTNGVWVASLAGELPTLVAQLPGLHAPRWWSPDGQWLLCGPSTECLSRAWPSLAFVRVADRFVFRFETPKSVGNDLGLSTDGKRLLFYKDSYLIRDVIKVAAVRGGAPVEQKMPRPLDSVYVWGRVDAQRWAFTGTDNQGKRVLMVVSAAGGEPVEMKINVAPGGENIGWGAISPDSKRLFLTVNRGYKAGQYLRDGYVVGISLDRCETAGAPALVFQDWDNPALVAWSPDSTRLIVSTRGDSGRKGDLWVVPVEGGPPSQLTHSPDEPEGNATLSPDGQTIAYTMDSSGKSTVYIMPSAGGTPRALWTQSRPAGDGEHTWFPDSKEIGVLSDDGIVAVSIADGKARPFLKFADAGFDWLSWFEWSPDGRTLGLYGPKGEENGAIALFHASDGKIEKLPNDPSDKYGFNWTPDSQAICYTATQPQKVRPAGVVRELDLDEAFQKAVAAAPPVQDKPSAPAQDVNLPSLVNGEYTDHFDGPLASCWKGSDATNWPNGVREVQNGALVLENAFVQLGRLDWTNYSFKVRMCPKSLVGHSSMMGVAFHRNGGRVYWLSAWPDTQHLELGVTTRGPANEGHFAAITTATCDFAFDKWCTMEVEVWGAHIKASVDGRLLIEVDDATNPQGAIELRALGARAVFDDFSVRLLP